MLKNFFQNNGKNKTIRQIRRNYLVEYDTDMVQKTESRNKNCKFYNKLGTIIGKTLRNDNDKNLKRLAIVYNEYISNVPTPPCTKVQNIVTLYLIRCTCCNKWILRDKAVETYNGLVCGECKRRNFILSTLQNAWVRKSYCGQTRNGDYALPEWFENNGYISIYDGGRDVWVKANTPEAWPLGILDYHGSKRYVGKISDAKVDKQLQPIYCGYELEVECTDSCERENLASKMLKLLRDDTDDYCYVCAEYDGSLGSSGFELVSSYSGLDTHWDKIQRLKGKTAGLKSDRGRSCGLHVHISRQYMSLYHCAKVAAMMSLPDNQNFLERFARRTANDYCARKSKNDLKQAYTEVTHHKDARHLNRNRYEVVNFQNKNTVEFRLFKGSLKPTTIMASIEFSKAVVMYCKNAGLGQLHWTNLVDWIYRPDNKDETIRLRKYLRSLNLQPSWFKSPRKRILAVAQ